MNRPQNKIQTHFEEPGSLPKPGLVGRIVRLLLAVWLLSGLYTMLTGGITLLSSTRAPSNWSFWVMMPIVFHITPYVVNIGFGKDWRRKPQLFVVVAAAVLLAADFAIYGTWWAPPLGTFVWVWFVYFTAHLGGSFALATVLGTPGCEMRAISQLWTLLTGKATKEHYCPGFIDRLDRWETKPRSVRA